MSDEKQPLTPGQEAALLHAEYVTARTAVHRFVRNTKRTKKNYAVNLKRLEQMEARLEQDIEDLKDT